MSLLGYVHVAHRAWTDLGLDISETMILAQQANNLAKVEKKKQGLRWKSSPTNILEQLKERYVLNGVLRLKW